MNAVSFFEQRLEKIKEGKEPCRDLENCQQSIQDFVQKNFHNHWFTTYLGQESHSRDLQVITVKFYYDFKSLEIAPVFTIAQKKAKEVSATESKETKAKEPKLPKDPLEFTLIGRIEKISGNVFCGCKATKFELKCNDNANPIFRQVTEAALLLINQHISLT